MVHIFVIESGSHVQLIIDVVNTFNVELGQLCNSANIEHNGKTHSETLQ